MWCCLLSMDPYTLTVPAYFSGVFKAQIESLKYQMRSFWISFFVQREDLCFLDVRGKKKKEGIHLCQEERQTRPGGGEWTEERDTREMLVFHQKRIPPVASGLCILWVLTWPRGLPKLLPPFSPFQIVHLPWNGSPLGSWSPLYFLGDVNHGSYFLAIETNPGRSKQGVNIMKML